MKNFGLKRSNEMRNLAEFTDAELEELKSITCESYDYTIDTNVTIEQECELNECK